MVDPMSLGALGAVAITEGIKFLYTQAGEILRRRRERRDAQHAGAAPSDEPIAIDDRGGLLEGKLAPLQVDDKAADALADEVKRLRAELLEYADGSEVASEQDPDVVRKTLALREAIESIVGQRITFRGENRDPSGTPVITGTVTAAEIRGRATGVEADRVLEGRVEGRVDAGTIEEGGDATGVRVRDVGGFNPGPRPRE